MVQLSLSLDSNTDMKYFPKSTGYLGLLLLLLISLSSCSSGYQERSAHRLPEGWKEKNLVHDGIVRWYRIYLPDPLPENPSLVLYLHGGTLSMRSLFSPLADNTDSWLRIA